MGRTSDRSSATDTPKDGGKRCRHRRSTEPGFDATSPGWSRFSLFAPLLHANEKPLLPAGKRLQVRTKDVRGELVAASEHQRTDHATAFFNSCASTSHHAVVHLRHCRCYCCCCCCCCCWPLPAAPKACRMQTREHLVRHILVAELVDVLEVRRPGLLLKIGDQREADTRWSDSTSVAPLPTRVHTFHSWGVAGLSSQYPPCTTGAQ